MNKQTGVVPEINSDESLISFSYRRVIKIVSEYDKEIPQLQPAGRPMAPRGSTGGHQWNYREIA